MSIRYYKLFDLLNRKNMKKSDLRKVISSATVAKLSKGEYISGEAIEKICFFLNCQPGDIMEVIYNETKYDDNSEIYNTNHINTEWNEQPNLTDVVTHWRNKENNSNDIIDTQTKEIK